LRLDFLFEGLNNEAMFNIKGKVMKKYFLLLGFLFLSIGLNCYFLFYLLKFSSFSLFQKAQIEELLSQFKKAPETKDQEETSFTKLLEIEEKIKNLEDSLQSMVGYSKENLSTEDEINQRLDTLFNEFFEFKKQFISLNEENLKIQKEILALIDNIERTNESSTETTEEKEKIEEPKKTQERIKPLLITEVASGFDSLKNEFIEIYNPNDFPVEINDDNFVLELVDSQNRKTQKRIDWKRNIIPERGFFLFIGGEIKTKNQKLEGDAYFSSQLASISGVVIRKKKGEVFDRVGWGKPNSPIPILATELKAKLKDGGLKTGESLQRKIQNSEFIDTNNNENDFEFSLILTPQNSLGERLIYSKVQSLALEEKQRKAQQEKTEQVFDQENSKMLDWSQKEKILITEVHIEGDEFVKFFNPGNTPVSLKDKYLAYFSQNRLIKEPYRLWKIDENLVISPNSHFTIAICLKEDSTLNPDWQLLTKENKPYSKAQIASDGAIGLFDCDPKEEGEKCKIDLVGWGKAKVFEREPALFPKGSTLLLRKGINSSYQDTDNNLNDFEAR